ncbi:UNKNOWN [Stylonychia lemnae]|uniref:Uncharacterized protein n=1 Tax=Stylonychia lemnae TaxID=5949 RepID=A0A078B7B8_STYLE|nr:UNKNOWN [Stylonychia lemnae]|eukprot:CDW90375.1 UNKNOWN [Stylonychia lemnae]
MSIVVERVKAKYSPPNYIIFNTPSIIILFKGMQKGVSLQLVYLFISMKIIVKDEIIIEGMYIRIGSQNNPKVNQSDLNLAT